MVLSAGQCIGPYEIVSALGAGGMREVYRAHDAKPKRDVALKVLVLRRNSIPPTVTAIRKATGSERYDRRT